MKHMRTAVLLILLALSSIARAETRLGLEGGVNFNKVSTSPDQNLSSRAGLLGGAFLDIGLAGGMFSLVPEVRYTQKGFTADPVYQVGSYLEVPVLVKAKLPLGEILTPYLVAGPAIGWNFANYYSKTIAAVNTNALELALQLGAGAELALPGLPVHLGAQLVYSLGLTNIVDNSAPNFGFTATNQGLQLSGNISFAVF